MSSKGGPSRSNGSPPRAPFPGGELAEVLEHVILPRMISAGIEGLFKFEIKGDGGGVRYLRVGKEAEMLESVPADQHPDVIVRTDRVAFESMISGRLKLSDGLITERVSAVGNITKIVALKNLIAKASA